jgi:predicted O-methyltransferase YrrM
MSKIATWIHAATASARGLTFWSPATFQHSQRFVRHVNQFAFVEKHHNPLMREVSAKAVLEDCDFQGICLGAYGPYCGQSPLEILVLCGLAKARRPAVILEIGTFQGFTTLLLAQNTPATTHLVTIDLPAGPVETRYGCTDPELVAKRGARVDLWEEYGVRSRIDQILCDSAALHPGDLPAGIDFVLVDGSHSYEYVESDTRLALQVLVPSGLLLWDDYSPEKHGVFRYLNELASTRPLAHVKDTELVYYDPARGTNQSRDGERVARQGPPAATDLGEPVGADYGRRS